ncbi:MAG: prepilin peptidase [Actinobacteria bacterium]|nr:prepilin peptidase [Actinomycetota bacterium]
MSPTLLLYVAVGLLGLAIGSFLNVVIYRVPRDESLISPASHCPRCERTIRPWHNIPVASWLILRGRCRDCRSPISARYPLVEASTAVLFLAITWRFGVSVELPAYLYLAAIAVALAMIDFDVQRLPDSIVLPSYVVGVLLLMPAGAADGNWESAVRGLVAMAGLLFIYTALFFAYPGGIGLGDVKLAGLLGLYLGWVSWSSVLVGTFAGFLIGGTVGTALIAARRATGKSAIPFGPFMLAGAVLALFVTTPVSHWYGHLLTRST